MKDISTAHLFEERLITWLGKRFHLLILYFGPVDPVFQAGLAGGGKIKNEKLGSAHSFYGIVSFHLHESRRFPLFFLKFTSAVFLFLHLCFACFSPGSISSVPLGPFSNPHLRPLLWFSDNEQRKTWRCVVIRVSAAVYRLSNVLLRGRRDLCPPDCPRFCPPSDGPQQVY